MMRIKEAIQRRKLIQQLNDEYLSSHIDTEQHPHGLNAKLSCTTTYGGWGTPSEGEEGSKRGTDFAGLAESHEAYISLAQFVGEFNGRLSDGHRRALRVTWNRLSEPPKTSGRGVLKIMEKIFDELMAKNPEMINCFYRSAFIKCLEDRKRRIRGTGTIVTIRDHAHLLIELVDSIMCVLFDVPRQKPIWDPVTIGRVHARLIPFGFNKEIWHSLGAIFAEVMFCQECVRAYPLAASAWSMLSVSLTDRMFRHTKLPLSQLRSVSKTNGDWSQQESLNADTALLSLSAELQKKAMISLRGTGHLGSTASSFRRNRQEHEDAKQKEQQQHQMQKQSQHQQKRKKSVAAAGIGLPRKKTSNKDKRAVPADSGHADHNRRRSSSNVRRHPTLEKAPSFFSRTIASLASPMPSSGLSSAERNQSLERLRRRQSRGPYSPLAMSPLAKMPLGPQLSSNSSLLMMANKPQLAKSPLARQPSVMAKANSKPQLEKAFSTASSSQRPAAEQSNTPSSSGRLGRRIQRQANV